MASEEQSGSVLVGSLRGRTLGPGLIVLPGQGNTLAIETDAGVVILDASGYLHAESMIETLRQHTQAPVHAIVYSHGHHGYNAAVDVWQRHSEERGDPPPRLVGHENVLHRYARYRETERLQLRMVSIQFPAKKPVPLERLAPGLALHDPTETFRDHMTLVEGTRRVELIWAPSETDDSLAVWLPDDGLLCGGAATPGLTIPNIGTPLRTQRFTIRWADTLDRLAGLGATRLLTEFGPLIDGDDVETTLAATSKALRWLRDEVVRRMNAGMDETEILADMQYPAELFETPWMRPSYGAPDYIVRDLYREENGWWDRNPTTLHPAPPADAAAAVLSAIADPRAVLDRAQALADGGGDATRTPRYRSARPRPWARARGHRSSRAQGEALPGEIPRGRSLRVEILLPVECRSSRRRRDELDPSAVRPGLPVESGHQPRFSGRVGARP